MHLLIMKSYSFFQQMFTRNLPCVKPYQNIRDPSMKNTAKISALMTHYVLLGRIKSTVLFLNIVSDRAGQGRPTGLKLHRVEVGHHRKANNGQRPEGQMEGQSDRQRENPQQRPQNEGM